MTQAEPKARTEQLANPFRPGNGVAPPYLAGRDALLAEFERFLAEPPAPCELDADRSPRHRQDRPARRVRQRGPNAPAGSRLERELGDRHRDDERLAEAIVEDCDALRRRGSALAGVGQALERACGSSGRGA